MKRIFTILIALMAMTFTQCKPAPDGGEESTTRKVKVSCSISMNKNSRSDFSQLMTEGNIRWSDGRECVYLAVHGETPQIIELEAWADGDPLRLEFEGEAAEGLIVSGQEYDIWYFGHSQQLETPYINMTDEDSRLEGSIATQSGRLEDLGYCHIATTKVTAVTENDEVKLNLKGTLVNQIAIALLDLENVEELYGDAILGTEYALEYNGERYELNVTEDDNAKINVESATGISYVVLLPNANKETMIKHKKEDKTFAYTFHNYIKSNKIYYRTATDDKVALKWEEIEEMPEMPEPEQPGDNNNHEYVDLGLPSGLLWATCNVGATSPEEYGNYYAWGETTTKAEYTEENCSTYGLSNSELQSQGYIDSKGNLTAQYDAATANWGGDWRMPTKAEQEELLNNCTWIWITQNGVNGYKVTGQNGNCIFLPAAGCRVGSSLSRDGSDGYYWIPSHYVHNEAYYLNFHIFGYCIFSEYREYGRSVRPVLGGNFEEPAAQYAFVETSEITEITSNSAICGGNVTTDNGSAVTAKGVCWSTNPNPTIEDNKTTDGNGVGSFTSQIPNLVPNTQYYVRAYATNEAGTSYGDELSFTTLEEEINEIDGHEYVDLGLPSGLLWATCNVGANAPEEYGDYFAWGETTTKETYTEDNCSTYGKQMSDIAGNAQYDAATANWGGDWRMPTKAELDELLNNCTWTWTTQNGVSGYNVEGPNGNSIFLPAAGYRRGSSLYVAGGLGCHWSSAPYESDSYSAYYLYFSSDDHYMGSYYRYEGKSVRPVCGGNNAEPEEPETPEVPYNQTFTVNGVSFTMIAVEGGTFQMGATSEQGSDAFSRESPVHSVTLSSYSIGETEVTQELWEAVMGSNPSNFSGYPQRPVEKVSWNDCQEFITKLNQLTGKNFRLPTEAEWEYAARGGNKSQGYKYSGSNTIGNVAWSYSNSGNETHDVKTKQANELGIYDMSGNVYEWCQDWYGSYSSGSQTNPTGPSSGTHRVARGGSLNFNARDCRVSSREYYSPGSRFHYYGLRLVL